MGKRLTPAEYVDTEELLLRMRMQAEGARLNPYEHDGSYEICQKASELYSLNMPETTTHADLDMFYKLAGFLHYGTKRKLILACSLDDNSKQDLIAVLDSIQEKASKNAYNNAIDGSAVSTGKFGMFNTPIGTFGKRHGVPEEMVPRIIGLFAKVWELSKSGASSEELYTEVENVFSTWIRGIRAAVLSQILHCIDPETFPVLNGQQGRDCVFVCLGVEGLHDIEKATAYADNCRRISEFRDVNYPEVRNYREFDLVGFDLPRVHAKSAEVDPLEKISIYARVGDVVDFRDDESCLDSVREREAEVNVFEVLGITGTEIRHSRMLAWFLRQNQTHGLGDAVLRRFLGAVYDLEGQPDHLGMVLKGGLSGFAVLRERDDIDLRVVSSLDKVAILVENKVFSGEHDNQLNKYQEFAEAEYGDYSRYYVYLTPRGTESSSPELWRPMSYKQVLIWVEEALEEAEDSLSEESKALIKQYLNTVRRNVLDEDDVVNICREIYRKHRTAIDLIIKHRQQFVDDLGISEEVRWQSERLFPSMEEAGFEGVFSLTRSKCLEVERDGIYGVPNSMNASTVTMGPVSTTSVDILSRTLMGLWSEVVDISESEDYEPAVQLIKSESEEGADTVRVRVMSYAPSLDAANDLALQRGLTYIVDLSNDSLVDVLE
ncbi:MAG: PD-(D/E)XK nuclease family protein [Eggerthellaceae bacterium]|nr:PD-(D/E)XK nuclease family protein [Eggerthellaceae bacterium]